jgi:Ras-related C3 botulinum toxin substrate 1
VEYLERAMSAGASGGAAIKCVVVGDNGVGKSSLLISYSTNTFPTEFVPNVFQNYTKSVVIDGDEVNAVKVGLWDTAGQKDYDRLRPLSYAKADVLLICFAIDNPHSLTSVKVKWVPEVQVHIPGASYFLVGCKADLRSSPSADSTQLVTQEEGQLMADDVAAVAYLECSAMTQDGLKNVFETAIKQTVKRKGGNMGCCTVM